ncbi:transmembrane domain-containing protein [Cryptosporidium canis]|uniref:Transmembrane domain-containing protein n=1 Tax=Cryptosporidium canis TaxID=195482 RepID=A0A9D5DG37_9CRYT|nr:transmembrane domain-containing protein [Cryptosporidium canis]
MIGIHKKNYDSLLGIGFPTEGEKYAEALARDNIFMYDQVNYLSNCIIVLLVICHCLHTLLFGGDIPPSISRFKLDYAGIFSLILNILIPCFFFVQGWLKAFEVHNSTRFFSRLHLEYIFPIITYTLFYLVKLLFSHDDHLENLTSDEFAELLSQSNSFNPGLLLTLVLLFIINLFLDPIALVLVPNFYTSDSIITYTVDISSTTESNTSENCTPYRTVERKCFPVLNKLSIYKFIYCLIVTMIYDYLLKYLSGLGVVQTLYKPKFHSSVYIIILFIFCRILKNKPKLIYLLSIASSIYEIFIYSSFDSYINNHFSTSLISTIHFLLYVYLTGMVAPCLQLKIFEMWPISIFFLIVSVLCYLISLEYSRSVVSPVIFPSILSIKSRVLTASQIFSSIFAIFGLSILSLKYINTNCDHSLGGSKRLKYTVLLSFSAMLLISILQLFLEDYSVGEWAS